MSPKFAPPAPPADLNRFLRKFKIDQVVLVLFLWVLTFVMSACSLSGQSGNNFSAPPTTTSATRNSKPERISRGLTVKPSTVSVAPGASVQFIASVHNLSSTHVTWSASAG